MPDRETDVLTGAKEPLWKRSLPIVGSLLLVLFIFGYLLPQFVDYDAVFRAIGEISVSEWLLLLVASVLRVVPEGWIYQASLPGISTNQGITQFLVTAAVNNVPPGGLDLVARYQMARSWGVSASGATTATMGSWFFVSYPKLLLPVIAVVLLDIRRLGDATIDFLAILGLVVTIVLTVLFIIAMRSERFVLALGRLATRFTNWAMRLLRKGPSLDLEDMALRFRDDALSLVRKRWKYGFPAGMLAQLSQYAVLLLAISAVGLEEVDWVVAFAAFSVVAIVGTIPIANAPGIAEAIYIGILSWAVGGGMTDQITAAVFVFRLLTWVLPIPLGGLAYARWRTWVRKNPEVLLSVSDG